MKNTMYMGLICLAAMFTTIKTNAQSTITDDEGNVYVEVTNLSDLNGAKDVTIKPVGVTLAPGMDVFTYLNGGGDYEVNVEVQGRNRQRMNRGRISCRIIGARGCYRGYWGVAASGEMVAKDPALFGQSTNQDGDYAVVQKGGKLYYNRETDSFIITE